MWAVCTNTSCYNLFLFTNRQNIIPTNETYWWVSQSCIFQADSEASRVKKDFRAARQKNLPLHFLLVDDDSVYHKMMAYRFKILNWTATSVFNGKEAIELYRKNGFAGVDVILMDKHMPVMSGQETTTKLVAMGCRTPIIALTGTNNNDVMKGAMGVLSKPLQIPNLLHALLRGQQMMVILQ